MRAARLIGGLMELDREVVSSAERDAFFADPWRGFDPVTPSPVPIYQRLKLVRELEPVFPFPNGVWSLTRYSDVSRVLRATDIEVGVRTTDGRLPFVDETATNRRLFMLQQDPPDHTRLRRVMAKAFAPHSIAQMREVIQKKVDELLDSLLPTGSMDVINDLALAVPTEIIGWMLSVPPSDRMMLTQWTVAITYGIDQKLASAEQAREATLAGMELCGYFSQLIQSKRGHLAEDFASELIRSCDRDQTISPEELIVQMVGLMQGAIETTVGVIGSGVRQLIEHPEELAKLRRAPALIDRAADECLRFDTSVMHATRVLHEAAEFGGIRIPKDSVIFASIAAANRDPRQFSRPDTFDIERHPNPHLSFAAGAHYCIGASLAREEIQIAIGSLVRRTKNLRLVDDRVVWRDTRFRVPGSLRVTFEEEA